MIERGISRKIEEAQTQGLKQRLLTRFLYVSFKLLKACGLTDITEESSEILTSKEEELWSLQIEKLINLGFHAELGMTDDEYKATMPAFQPQPPRFKGRFDIPLLVDPRVSLQRQLELSKIVNYDINEADLTRLSLAESNKPHIPKDPYQLWIRAILESLDLARRLGKFKPLRSIKEFTYDERGLTAIEGLALLREQPNLLYNGFFGGMLEPQGGLLLLDSYTAPGKILVLYPIGKFHSPAMPATLKVTAVNEFTSSYNLISCGKIQMS